MPMLTSHLLFAMFQEKCAHEVNAEIDDHTGSHGVQSQHKGSWVTLGRWLDYCHMRSLASTLSWPVLVSSGCCNKVSQTGGEGRGGGGGGGY